MQCDIYSRYFNEVISGVFSNETVSIWNKSLHGLCVWYKLKAISAQTKFGQSHLPMFFSHLLT